MYLDRKNYYKNIAKETLDIIKKGYYINNDNEKIIIKHLIDRAIEKTELILDNNDYSKIEVYKSDGNSNENRGKEYNKNIQIINNSTIDTIIQIRKEGIGGNIIALNFASAKNPGGGFKNGTNAQEESIVRSSALYPCLIKNYKGFYDYHYKQNTPLYSDRMIYSPDVPIFRDNDGNLLNKPLFCSFITSPAVNAKVALEKGFTYEMINKTMQKRIGKILDLAINKEPKVLILGAFGCGVFKNNPNDISKIFAIEIKKRQNQISNFKIIFAIYDTHGKIIKPFYNVFT